MRGAEELRSGNLKTAKIRIPGLGLDRNIAGGVRCCAWNLRGGCRIVRCGKGSPARIDGDEAFERTILDHMQLRNSGAAILCIADFPLCRDKIHR